MCCLFSAVAGGAGAKSNGASSSASSVDGVTDLIEVHASAQVGVLLLRSKALNQTLQLAGGRHGTALTVNVVETAADTKFDGVYERIFGVYKLPAGHCVAFVKRSEPVASFVSGAHEVRKVVEISFVEVPTAAASSAAVAGAGGTGAANNEAMLEKQRDAVALMQEAFARHSFYFSTSDIFDVTRTMQSNAARDASASSSAPLWQSCDERFFWNLNAVSDLVDAPGLRGGWVTPFVNAWVATQTLTVGRQAFNLTLISRRSRRRQGPRYIKRGSDGLGDVANFVETEQVRT